MVSPQNDFYGHRRILNAHVGAPSGTRFIGLVQHGWEIDPWRPRTARLHLRRFGWSRRSWSPEHAARLKLIGAPFLYHPTVAAGPFSGGEGRLLVMPYHNYGTDLDDAHKQYASFIETFDSSITDVTICLHPFEFASSIRDLYASHGFQVVTNGERRDARFLDRLVGLLEGHATVTSNRMSTGVLYAAAVGRSVVVRGPFPRSADRLRADVPYEAQLRQYVEAFPQLAAGVSGREARDLGGRELGAEFVRPPADLARVLMARWPAQALPRAVALANSARKRVVRRDFGPSPAALGQGGHHAEALTVVAPADRDEPSAGERR